MDDAPGEPEREAGKVQAEIRIHGRWFYRGITADVPTLQRLLADAVRASDRLIARLRKARAQRDTARAQAERSAERRYQIECIDLPAAVREAHDSWRPTIAALIRTTTRTLPGDPGHYVEYGLTPEILAYTVNGDLLKFTVERLMKQFEADGHTARRILIGVRDW